MSEAAPPIAPPPPALHLDWGPWSALAVFAISYVLQILLGLLVAVFATLVLVTLDPSLSSYPDQMQDAVLVVTIMPAALGGSALTLALVYGAMRLVHHLPVAAGLGLAWPGWRRVWKYVLGGAGVAAAGVALIVAFPPGPDQEFSGPLRKLVESGSLGFAAWVFLGVVVAPVTEEVLFRGYLYQGMRRRLPPLAAGILVSVLFVVPHMAETGTYWPALAGIAMLAVVLTLVVEKTGSLACCIAGHAGYNALLATMSLAGPG
ncbi:MAG: lysostaphin resistance A-like protein [Candidatus Polarisedimenticolia bacterium]